MGRLAATVVRWTSVRGRHRDGVTRYSIRALLELSRSTDPSMDNTGMTGVNRERTVTRTQSPGWQLPLTLTPSISMQL